MIYFLGYILGVLVSFLIGVNITSNKMIDFSPSQWNTFIVGSLLWPLMWTFWILLIVTSDRLSVEGIRAFLFFGITEKKILLTRQEVNIRRNTRIRNEWMENEARDRANEMAFGSEPVGDDQEYLDNIDQVDNSVTGVKKEPIIIIGVSSGKNRNKNDYTNAKIEVSEDLIKGGIR